MTGSLLLLRGPDIEKLVSLEEVVGTQRDAFSALSADLAVLGTRVLLPGLDASTAFSYAARMSPATSPVAKFGAVVPANARAGHPVVSAIVTVLDAVTGAPRAVLDGEAITNLRTPAASALAASTLATDTSRVAIIGWGAQGRLHARALAEVLCPEQILVYSPNLEPGIEWEVTPGYRARSTGSVADCVRDAGLVVTTTTSRTPVVLDSWIEPQALVLTVGSFAPDRCEVGNDILTGAAVFVDHIPTALSQCGPIRNAVGAGILDPDSLIEIGAVINGATGGLRAGRSVYASVGVGIQDAAIADLLVERAGELGVGEAVQW